jgi:TPR repeat protein
MATALAYLNNNRGQRDATTAAQWLWAATRKGDTGANIVLADLYIRGDGVPQNCAQGRVLLLAASKKGNDQATQNLQQLNATGCGTSTP